MSAFRDKSEEHTRDPIDISSSSPSPTTPNLPTSVFSFDETRASPILKAVNNKSSQNLQSLRKIAIKPLASSNGPSKQGIIKTVFTPESYQQSTNHQQRTSAEAMSETRPTKLTLKFRDEVNQQLQKHEQQQKIIQLQKQKQLQQQLEMHRQQQQNQQQQSPHQNGVQHPDGEANLSEKPVIAPVSNMSPSPSIQKSLPVFPRTASAPIQSSSPPSQTSSPATTQTSTIVPTSSSHISILPATASVASTSQVRTPHADDLSSLSFLPPMTLPPNTQSHPQYFKELKPVRPPRSKEFYRIGPNFERTCQNFDLCDPNGVPVYTIISARFDRGFKKFPNSDSWLSYRRNYFTLTSSFSLVQKGNFSIGKIPPFPVYAAQDGKIKSKVLSFAIRITALRVCIDGDVEELPLVQHTAKRDKGPRDAPAIVPAIPGLLPDHNFMRNNTHYRSSSRLQKIEPFFYRKVGPELGPFCENYPPDDKVAHVVLHDRVQFTTAGGGGSQICKAVVQLIATLEDGSSYVVAWSETQPFTLRNRSPGNYYDDGTLIPRAKKAFYAKTYGEEGEEEVKNENPDENNPEKKLNDLLMKHAHALSHKILKDYRELEEDTDEDFGASDGGGQSDINNGLDESSTFMDLKELKKLDNEIKNQLPSLEPSHLHNQIDPDHSVGTYSHTSYASLQSPDAAKLLKTVKPPGPGQTTFDLEQPLISGARDNSSGLSAAKVETTATSAKSGSDYGEPNGITQPQQSTIRVHPQSPQIKESPGP